MDSPRGRIHLMEARLDGTIALNRTVVEHFDRCLGCMACVTACPSGVRYDLLIEATRDAVEREHGREPSERLAAGGALRGAAVPAAAAARAPTRAARPLRAGPARHDGPARTAPTLAPAPADA